MTSFLSPAAVTDTPTPSREGATASGNGCGSFSPSSCQTTPAEVDCCMRNRVQRVMKDLAAGRAVADEEIRRHIEDLRFLLETSHDRFLASGLPRQESPDYAQAQEFRRLRDEALHMLSPEFKRARHLEVLRRAAAEPGGINQGNHA